MQLARKLAKDDQRTIHRIRELVLDFTNVPKTQKVTPPGKSDRVGILSSAEYDKLKLVRYQAVRWVTQKRLGWQRGFVIRSGNPSPA